MIGSADWLGAEAVALDGSSGPFVASSTVTVPRSVKRIEGFGGAWIKLTGGSFKHDSLPKTDDDRYVRKLIVSGTSGGFENFHNLVDCRARDTGNLGFDLFVNCHRLVACDAECAAQGYTYTYGFLNCETLTACRVLNPNDVPELASEVMPVAGDPGSGWAAFGNCRYLVNCQVINTAVGNFGQNGFENCLDLVNCSVIEGYAVHGFTGCQRLTNCSVKQTAAAYNRWGFVSCEDLMACYAEIYNSLSYGDGYRSCRRLSSCQANVSFADNVSGNGFSYCEQLSDCWSDVQKQIATIPYGGETAVPTAGYGYYNCSYVNGCRAGLTVNGALGGTNTKVDTSTT